GNMRTSRTPIHYHSAMLRTALAIALVAASSATVRAGEKSEFILSGPVDGNTGSSGQRTVAEALETINGACLGPPLFFGPSICSAAAVMDGGDVDGDSLDVRSDIVAQQLSAQADIQANTTDMSSPNVFVARVLDRLTLLRAGGAAGDSSMFAGRLGVFANASGGFGDTDTNEGETGFTSDVANVTGGVDYRFTDYLTGGLTLGYTHSDFDLALNSGELNADTYRIAPFISVVPIENAYLDALIGYARVDFDSIRLSNLVTNPFSPAGRINARAAEAEFSANQFFTSLGAGYLFRREAWTVRPYARFEYVHLDVENYGETGNGGPNTIEGSLNLNVSAQNVSSVTSVLGAEAGYTFSTPLGVVTPRVRAEWVHEYRNSSREIFAEFQGAIAAGISAPMRLSTAGPERNWANLGFNLQMNLPYSVAGFVGYETVIVEDSSNHVVLGGLRYEF
ncbi:MAG: autotransporter outer membrane beta-barrel domain-containing protein, partial [Gammaproteobacteria bacterium]